MEANSYNQNEHEINSRQGKQWVGAIKTETESLQEPKISNLVAITIEDCHFQFLGCVLYSGFHACFPSGSCAVPVGCLWIVRGVSVGYLWGLLGGNIRGVYFGCPWGVGGVFLGRPCGVLGMSVRRICGGVCALSVGRP